ncbi:Protein kinase superfamily protein [Prunus dulcis]|uniref:Protein kinase superfamily protein n=1 Tax=Prunus dulcis TaxID=3755 RepID=A0A4Y1QLC7_PRUDU|nr:Protein kinase superfamily protein [Prunus dulcis]
MMNIEESPMVVDEILAFVLLCDIHHRCSTINISHGCTAGSTDTPNLPLPADLPVSHRHWQKHFLPRAAPVALSPALPPFYGPLITAGHPLQLLDCQGQQ